jgi:hypothetical protein
MPQRESGAVTIQVSLLNQSVPRDSQSVGGSVTVIHWILLKILLWVNAGWPNSFDTLYGTFFHKDVLPQDSARATLF